MKLLSFLCLAASQTAHIHHFSCVYIVSYHNCFVCITFFEHVTFSCCFSHLENVWECCKVQWVSGHQRIALCKSYLLFLLFLDNTVKPWWKNTPMRDHQKMWADVILNGFLNTGASWEKNVSCKSPNCVTKAQTNKKGCDILLNVHNYCCLFLTHTW